MRNMNSLYRKMKIIVIIALLTGSSINFVIGIEGEKVVSSSTNNEPFLSVTVQNSESNSNYDYAIITCKDFESSSFQLLIDHKSQYMNATIVILEDILENSSFWVNGTYGDATNISDGNLYVEDDKDVSANFSSFNDTAAIMRNFIRFAHQKWGIEYVLLGGDVEIIPTRRLYVNLSDWNTGLIGEIPKEGWIPSDLYFGCLDGTWNDDFDKKFGEQKEYSIDEEADFIAEVYIGRAPVDNKYEVTTFVKKVIQFETTEKPKDILLHQANLNDWNFPDTTVIPEACAKQITNDYIIHKLYQKNGEISVTDWINCFNKPNKLLILHVGNGFTDYLHGAGNSWYELYNSPRGAVYFETGDIYKIRNTFYPIHISISCCSGDFTASDCIAEELLLWSYGGPSACFFNSEVGCVNNTDASKYSAEFIEKIFYEMFENNTKELGKINYFSKYHFINISELDPTYRWCYYEINLLGDPETPVTGIRDRLPLFTVFVDDDFNEYTPDWNITCFSKIQDAINMIPDHGIINVNAGIYNETIVINNTIQLIGEDKNTTIIECSDSEIVITANSNSSLIKNFTIRHNTSTQNIQNQIGIYIPKDCWGNDISNNIITNNNNCGILINYSCRTYIHENIIQFNGEGVCIVNKLERIFLYNVVLTCHNMVHNNSIVSNEKYGIYLEGSLHNEILNNNIMNNNGSYGLVSSNSDAFFRVSRSTTWGGNYWGEPCTEKMINGTRGPHFFWYPDFSHGSNIIERLRNGLFFPTKIYWMILNVGFKYSDIDKNPAQEPYDIR